MVEVIDEIREQVHAELSLCTSEAFLARYLELDPDFEDTLSQIASDEDD